MDVGGGRSFFGIYDNDSFVLRRGPKIIVTTTQKVRDIRKICLFERGNSSSSSLQDFTFFLAQSRIGGG